MRVAVEQSQSLGCRRSASAVAASLCRRTKKGWHGISKMSNLQIPAFAGTRPGACCLSRTRSFLGSGETYAASPSTRSKLWLRLTLWVAFLLGRMLA